MYNEITYPIGHHPTPRRKTAKTAVPPVGGICIMDAKTKGCRRNQKGHKEISPDIPTAHAFLKTTFMPKLLKGGAMKPPEEIQVLENDFYKSLSRLANHYGIAELNHTKPLGYPYNIAYSIWETENFLKKKVGNWNSLRLVQDADKAYLVSQECHFIGATLYYIPIIPLFLMLRDSSKKKAAQLLLSVCSYLYHMADIPYYRQQGSYLYWEYEMLGNWVEDDQEADDTTHYKRELCEAQWVGEKMEQKLFNRKNLDVFKDRLIAFKPHNDFEKECRQVAQNALYLYEKYPNSTYYRNAGTKNEESDGYQGEHEEETITMDKYVSFYADSSGWLAENLLECVNNEFNEYGKIEEPTLCKRFDGNPLEESNLDFEKRLFTLMDDLIYLLSNYKRKNDE
ncbi:hypothetical protein CLU96_2360 [Chryseobacterium sp. 52]|uniref:hypothetical protein n=1 Tax=Chryseobacterium sp. 52 TaxID=2035213 RepID=UPI000C542F94|nr:hypothetical protein [Chryseobacterium sp. 52]PIF45358.1 hypothetical protein CLU96_2360 [Chryseobacterium sp. 52]